MQHRFEAPRPLLRRAAVLAVAAMLAAPSGCVDRVDDATGGTGGGGGEADSGFGSGFDGGGGSGVDGGADGETGNGGEAEAKDRLISVWRTTSTVEVGVTDLVSAAGTAVGPLDDLTAWSGETALSADGTMLYALGSPDGSVPTQSMYVFDLGTEALAHKAVDAFGPQANVVLAGFDHHDRLIAVQQSDAAREVVSIDPLTAAVTVLGPLGTLQAWSGQTALSADGAMLYALGYPGNSTPIWTLYAFDLDADAFAYDVLDVFEAQHNAILAGVDHQDRLIAVRQGDTAREVVAVDALTGAVTVLGALGTLGAWTGQTALSADGTMLYALGYAGDANPDWTMYAFDLDAGAFAYEVANHAHLERSVILAGFGQ